MERDKRSLKATTDSEEEKMNPHALQEYEFFVHGRGGEAGAGIPGGRRAKEKEGNKADPNKSRVFFASGDETDG